MKKRIIEFIPVGLMIILLAVNYIFEILPSATNGTIIAIATPLFIIYLFRNWKLDHPS